MKNVSEKRYLYLFFKLLYSWKPDLNTIGDFLRIQCSEKKTLQFSDIQRKRDIFKEFLLSSDNDLTTLH